MTSRALARSHLVLIPFNLSPIDAELAANAVALVQEEAEALGRSIPFRLVRSRDNAAIETKTAKRIVTAINDAALPLLTAALAKTQLYIGNDSGLMHMAAAVGTPTVGLFGPTRADHYSPWGEKTRVVRTKSSIQQLKSAPGYHHTTTGSLMGEITVDQVLAAVTDLAGDSPCQYPP